jgi:hypothetical protein
VTKEWDLFRPFLCIVLDAYIAFYSVDTALHCITLPLPLCRLLLALYHRILPLLRASRKPLVVHLKGHIATHNTLHQSSTHHRR